MQPGTKKLLRFIQTWVINTIAVFLAAVSLRNHIHYNSNTDLIWAALLLGILNAFVRPILMLIALPLLIFTLGLFMLVINALLLYFVGFLLQPNFYVDSFRYAFLGAIIIGLISFLLNVMTGNSQVTVNRQQRPPDNKGSGGNGPVIDV
jgi:putative membrane protein